MHAEGRPRRHPATLGLLTTGAAHTHRGLRPTQAWLFPGAVPAQRHLLRTLTEPPGPPCERERDDRPPPAQPRRLSVPARGRGHDRSDTPPAPAEQRLLSRSPGRAVPAGARCICKEAAAHWPAGGGACGDGPIKGRPGERGARGWGGDEVTIGHSAERPPPAGPGWGPRGAGMGASGRGAAGPAGCSSRQRGRGGVDERQRRGGPPQRTAKPAFTAAMHKFQRRAKNSMFIVFFILLWNGFVILVEARISSQSCKGGKKTFGNACGGKRLESLKHAKCYFSCTSFV